MLWEVLLDKLLPSNLPHDYDFWPNVSELADPVFASSQARVFAIRR